MSEITDLAALALPAYTPSGRDGDAGSGSSPAAVSETVTGLEAETLFWFRAIASNASATVYGDALTFTTWPHSRVAVHRESVPDKLAVSLTSPDGVPYRWADDEPNPENVITGLRLVDEIPGGEKEAGGTLARDPRRDWRDQQGFGEFKVYGPGGEVVWGPGRLSKVGKTRSEGLATEPLAVGNQAALDDNRALIGPGFIDGDLSKWGEPSTQRRVDLIANGHNLNAFNVSHGSQDQGSAAPGISFATDQLVSGTKEHGEQWYYGGGVDLGELLYDFVTSGGRDADWVDYVGLLSDDIPSSYDIGTDHNQASASGQSLAASTAGRKYAYVEVHYGGGATGQYLSYHDFRNLRVLGTHGLTPQGTFPDIGFTAAQMLEYAIPLHTSLDLGEMQDDGFVIPQAWFSDPGPMSAVVAELTRYGLYDWAVWGNEFSLRAPGTYGRTWIARATECGFSEEGLDTERLWESIVVAYTDVDGSTRTVGPPGSGATVEDASLQIDDADHPAVKAGVTRRDVLQMSGSATSGLAIAVGQRWLEDANELSRSGQARLTGYCLDDKAVMRPVSQVRAGDRIRFIDLADSSPRRIMRRGYEHDSRSVAVDVDAPSQGISALLERLQVRLARLGG